MDQKEQQRKRIKASRGLATVYRRLFHTDDGEKVLKDLMKAHYCLSTTMDNAANIQQISFREGQRYAIIRILDILKVDPLKYEEMLQNIDKEKKEDWL